MQAVRISLLFLLSCCAFLSYPIKADDLLFPTEDSVTNINEIPLSIEHNESSTALKEEIFNQLDHIIFRLQQIGQQVNAKIVIVPRKESTVTHIAKTINFAQQLQEQISNEIDTESIQKIAEITIGLTHYVLGCVEKNLEGFFTFDGMNKKIKYHGIILSTLELQKLLEKNALTLIKLDTQSRLLGLSWINRCAQKTDYIIKKMGVDQILQRSWPYVVLGHWWLIQSAPENIDAVTRGTFTSYKKMLDNLFESAIKTIKMYPDGQNKASAPLIESKTKTNSLGIRSLTGGIIDVDARSLFTLGIGGLVMPRIKEDLKDLSEALKRYHRKGCAQIKGTEAPKDKLKDPKFNFKKLIGFEGPKKQIQPAVAYLCDPDQFLRTGQKAHRGYLFIGPRYSRKRSLADALAGQVTELLKTNESFRVANGNQSVCKIYELHASELLKKPLKKVLEEAKSAAPCVTVITNLEWLNMKDRALVGDMIQAMTSYFKETKEGILIATTSDIDAINPDLMEAGRLTGKVYLDGPNYEERREFVETKLLDNGLRPEDFPLDTMAWATQNHSFKNLTVLLEQLFAYANVTKQPITAALFDEMVDREILHIINHQSLSPEEVKILACNFAGQAVIHILKNPAAQLLKVTILPVVNGASKTFGARFTYAEFQITARNYEDMKKECAIMIAGDVAQELLLGQGACPLIENKKKAFDLAYKILLNGIDDKLLSKSMSNKLRDEAHKLLETVTAQVRETLKNRYDSLLGIAQALEEKQTLSAEEIRSFLS